MAGHKNHEYHILPTSINPLIGSFAALTMFFGLVMLFQPKYFGGYGSLVFGAGLIGVLYTFYAWWSDVIKEAHAGDHTPVVQLHLRYGMILFIASEVMFFLGWFWAWFDFSLFPSALEIAKDAETHRITATNIVGTEGAAALEVWPPKGLEVLDAMKLPLLNTLILLCSGTTVTWAHHALIHGDRDGLKKGLWVTIILGIAFTCLQAVEYAEAPFSLGGTNYGSAFFMATGFHGFHVIIGTIFLAICLARVYKGHFTPKQHFGFEAAAWYWHFVDVVWLFLFMAVYVWGGWGAPVHG